MDKGHGGSSRLSTHMRHTGNNFVSPFFHIFNVFPLNFKPTLLQSSVYVKETLHDQELTHPLSK